MDESEIVTEVVPEGTPVVDPTHTDAIARIRRDGHLWGKWMPKRRTEVYRMCLLEECPASESMAVKA